MSLPVNNSENKQYTSLYGRLQTNFSMPAEAPGTQDTKEDWPPPEWLHDCARQAAQKIGVMMYEEGMLELEKLEAEEPDHFSPLQKRYSIGCYIMKDPVEIEKKFQEAQERISKLERKVREQKRKLDSIKDTVSDEV